MEEIKAEQYIYIHHEMTTCSVVKHIDKEEIAKIKEMGNEKAKQYIDDKCFNMYIELRNKVNEALKIY